MSQNGKILRPQIGDGHKCDDCKWAMPQPDGRLICFGAPPTVVVMGARQNMAGQQELIMNSQRPTMDPGQPACSLWGTRLAVLANG